MRLIDADALMAQLEDRQAFLVKGWGYRDHYARGFDEAVERVQKASTLDAVEVEHGRWEKYPHLYGYLCCSKCHDAYIWEEWLKDGKWNYCPNCGAKLDLPNTTEQTVDALNRMGEKVHGGE